MTDSIMQPLYELTASVHIDAAPAEVYQLVSDLARMGEWSPENVGGEWTDGEPGTVGARFLGRNENGPNSWTAPCEVIAAEQDRRFSWAVMVSDDEERRPIWSFELEPDEAGTTLTQRLYMGAPSPMLREVRDSLPEEHRDGFFAARGKELHNGMQETLNGIKATLEG